MPNEEEINRAGWAAMEAVNKSSFESRVVGDPLVFYRIVAKAALEAADKVRTEENTKLKEEVERLREENAELSMAIDMQMDLDVKKFEEALRNTGK